MEPAKRSASRLKACSPSAPSKCAARPTRFSSSQPPKSPRRDHLFKRQPCAGRRLCGARGGRQSRHRDALQCPRHQARGHPGAGRGSGGCGRGLKRAACNGREAGPEHGYVVIPPYDDDQIIAGQATCGLEIMEEWPEVDLVLTPVSGGGLLSGVADSRQAVQPPHAKSSASSRSLPATPRKAFAPAKSSPGARN